MDRDYFMQCNNHPYNFLLYRFNKVTPSLAPLWSFISTHPKRNLHEFYVFETEKSPDDCIVKLLVGVYSKPAADEPAWQPMAYVLSSSGQRF